MASCFFFVFLFSSSGWVFFVAGARIGGAKGPVDLVEAQRCRVGVQPWPLRVQVSAMRAASSNPRWSYACVCVHTACTDQIDIRCTYVCIHIQYILEVYASPQRLSGLVGPLFVFFKFCPKVHVFLQCVNEAGAKE